MTAGYFNNCDKMVTAEDVKPFRAGSVSAHLVISPLRRPEGMASYVEQVQNLCRLSKLFIAIHIESLSETNLIRNGCPQFRFFST